jgi:hypothetical protein
VHNTYTIALKIEYASQLFVHIYSKEMLATRIAPHIKKCSLSKPIYTKEINKKTQMNVFLGTILN